MNRSRYLRAAESRVLMGPGPSDVPASVLAALASPPSATSIQFSCACSTKPARCLRQVIGTHNELTHARERDRLRRHGGLHRSMRGACDRVLVGVHGVFGQRMAEVARRAGAEVVAVVAPWGRSLDLGPFAQGRSTGEQFKLVCIVHAETSTGALTPFAPFRALADELGALLLVDAVTSLAGVPVDMDRWASTLLYSGTQKCLSCPPGLSPVSLSDRARAVLDARKTPYRAGTWI